MYAPLTRNEPRGKARIVVDGATIASHDLYPIEDARGRDLPRAIDTVKLCPLTGRPIPPTAT
jgi:hypothetical protein